MLLTSLMSFYVMHAVSTYIFMVSGCSWVTDGGMRPLAFGVTVCKKDKRQVSTLRAISQDYLNPVHPRLLLELILKVLHVLQGPTRIPLHPGKVLAKSHQMRILRGHPPNFILTGQLAFLNHTHLWNQDCITLSRMHWAIFEQVSVQSCLLSSDNMWTMFALSRTDCSQPPAGCKLALSERTRWNQL